jgi:mannose-6-phosphate isomerase-like protein (cupin superfamily)
MKNFKKNFLKTESVFDFNKLSQFLDKNNFKSIISSNYLNDFILESVFQIRSIQNTLEFNNIFNELNKNFNKENLRSDLDIFFSMVSGSSSITHSDNYDVFIINLFGKVVYKVGGDIITLEPGDLIHIPKNIIHKAIGLTPRIILSFGIRDDLC